MCCGGMICKCCTLLLLVLVVILIGLLFGFGVFKHGFHKLKDSVHLDLTNYATAAGGGIIIIDSSYLNRAMEVKMRLKEGLVNENFDWVLPKFEEIVFAAKEIKHLEEDDNNTDKDDEERDEFFSLQRCFSSCSSASIEAFFCRSCFFRNSSASRIDDLWDAQRRLMIKELCHCKGWPFGLFRKAMLLPSLPKSPSESWTWRQGNQSSKIT